MKLIIEESLTERPNGQADFTVDLVEFKDDEFEDFDVIETIPVTVDEIIDRYGEKAYKAAVKGITREMLKDGIHTNGTLGVFITGVADTKVPRSSRRSKYGYGFENIRLVNDDLFDTNIGALQKQLGKMLLPPEGWTGRRVKESYTGNRYADADVGDEIEFYDNNNRFKGTVTGIAHKGNALLVQGKSGTTYKIDRNGRLLPCIDEIRCGGRTERFGDDLKWHKVEEGLPSEQVRKERYRDLGALPQYETELLRAKSNRERSEIIDRAQYDENLTDEEFDSLYAEAQRKGL